MIYRGEREREENTIGCMRKNHGYKPLYYQLQEAQLWNACIRQQVASSISSPHGAHVRLDEMHEDNHQIQKKMSENPKFKSSDIFSIIN